MMRGRKHLGFSARKLLNKVAGAGPAERMGLDVSIPVLMAMLLAVAVALLAVLGYRATGEWRRSATMVVERRTDEVAALLNTALVRDMRGVHESVLAPLNADQLAAADLYDVADIVARAFARFSYPESFFMWRPGPDARGTAVLFGRSDRPLGAEQFSAAPNIFPVRVFREAPLAYALTRSAKDHVLPRGQFVFFDTEIDGAPYQVVARFLYKDRANRDPVAVIGFTVNLDWARTVYFPELIAQVQRIGRNEATTALSISIVDEAGKIVTQTRPPVGGGPIREKTFPLAFFDFSNVPIGALGRIPLRQFVARVETAEDPLLRAANAGTNRTLILILCATGASIIGLLLAIRSLRTNFDLVAIKSDFTAVVSHELKSPLAGISLIGDTLAKGHATSPQTVAEYGAMILKETKRLGTLVENLLTLSRITDSRTVYMMTVVDVSEVIGEALARMQPQIEEKGFHVICRIPDDSPKISCDREAVIQVFENLIDNAVRYSDSDKKIEIDVSKWNGEVKVSVKDRGRGISPADVPHVFERYFRGKNAEAGGTGLGLAIARKVILDHGGRILIDSAVGRGSEVTIVIPAA